MHSCLISANIHYPQRAIATNRKPNAYQSISKTPQDNIKANYNTQQGMLAYSLIDNSHLPLSAPTFDTVRTTSKMVLQSAFFGPQPRDPPTGRAPPSRPRPPKPVQPRDDGCHRSPSACYGGAQQPQPGKPWPRDPGNGRQYAMQYAMGPAHRSLSDKQGGGNGGSSKPKPQPKPPQPRDGGKKRFARDPNPRDPGM